MNPTSTSTVNRNRETPEDAIVAEVFPIFESAVPPLFAYRLTLTQGEWNTVGGKAAYRLRRLLSGLWVWSSPWLLSDANVDDAAMTDAIRKLWDEDYRALGGITAIRLDSSGAITALHKAAFVARGVWDARGIGVRCARELEKDQHNYGSVRITRHLNVRPWEVNSNPALSLSIDSTIELSDDAWSVAQKRGEESLVGSWVCDRFGTFKGQVVKKTGSLEESRERLLHFNPKPEIARILRNGDAAQPIYAVQMRIAERALEYPGAALRPILTLAELKHYGVSPSDAQRHLRLAPGDRANLLKAVVNIARSAGIIGEAFATSRSGASERTLTTRYSAPDFRFGDGKRVHSKGLKVIQALLQRGAFQKPAEWDSYALRLGALAVGVKPTKAKPWLDSLLEELKHCGVRLDVDAFEECRRLDFDEFHRAVASLVNRRPDAMLIFMPGVYRSDDADQETDLFYTTFKDETIGRGIPSQVVYEATLPNASARANIVLGLFSKLGGVPYVLADPLTFADMVIGLDIGRRRKERLAGSMNLAATTRIFANSGEFLRYRIYDAQLEGETMPREVLQRLLPRSELSGKRVVVHRDGIFRGQELETLQAWEASIKTTLLCCEIRKQHIPRIYRFRGSRALQAQKGDCLILNDREAFLVSTPPPFAAATPQPLHVVRYGDWSIEQAIDSVLALSCLHHGSILQPRLPVSVHYSDRIAYLALRGIKPSRLEGSLPYWL